MFRFCVFVTLLSIHLATAGPVHAVKGRADKPRIYLEKRVIAEKSGEHIKFFEVYRLKKGDSMWKIFVDKLGGRREEFEIFLDAFKKANPEIEDPSLIRKNTSINLPMNVGTLGKRNIVSSMLNEGKIIEHTVVSGDYLWKIAPTEFNDTRDLLKFVEEVQKLNPFLKDPDWIFPGQKLYIPEFRYFAAKEMQSRQAFGRDEGEEHASGDERDMIGRKVKEGAESEDLSVDKPLLDRPQETAEGSLVGEKAYPEKIFEEEKAQVADADAATSFGAEKRPPFGLQKGPPRFRGLLGDILSALGERLVSEGEMYIPLDEGGELVLNMESFPIARFSEGTSLILDYWGSLPREVDAVLRDKWRGYFILRHEGEWNIEYYIESLLKNGGYYSVKEGKTSRLVIGERVSLSVNADLVVLKEQDSLLKGEVYAIDRQRTPSLAGRRARIYAYCHRAGVVVIPYYVDRTIDDGYVVSYLYETSDEITAREKVPEQLPDGIEYILDVAGVKSDRSRKISIKGQEGAFTLTIKPDLVFWIGDQAYILDPERFTEPIVKLLEREGYRIFRVKKNSSYASLIPRLLSMAGRENVLYDDEIIDGGEDQGYTIKVSGNMIKKEPPGADEDVLFVSGEVDLGMRELLSKDYRIRVVTY